MLMLVAPSVLAIEPEEAEPFSGPEAPDLATERDWSEPAGSGGDSRRRLVLRGLWKPGLPLVRNFPAGGLYGVLRCGA